MFFLNKIDSLNHMAWLQYYKLKPPHTAQPLFSECGNNRFIMHMHFCQINATKVVQSRPIKMGWFWTRRDFVATNTYLKFPQIGISQQISVRSTNQKDVSDYPLTCWEKLTFNQSFVSKHQIFSFENCCLGKKRRSKVSWDI